MAEEKQAGMSDSIKEVINAINRYYQEVTITGVSGDCPYGHKEGEKFRTTAMNHDCLCGSLYQTIHHPLFTQEYGGKLLWENTNGLFSSSCPEAGKVKVQVRRIKQEKPVHVRTKTEIKDMTDKYPVLKKYKLFIEIISIQHLCMWGHKEGERFEVDPFNMGKCCGSLYTSAYPFIHLLLTGGSLPWEGSDATVHGTCPDPYDLVAYRLVREER